MLNKTSKMFELAEKALTQATKVAFNNVFNEVKRENELNNLSKIIKSGSIVATKESKPTLQQNTNSGAANGSTYM